ncbi:hypothetical protein PN441_14545 [Spirulina major CS-329]|uniref:hypothetical protein n=1 Tax=Spirulina TaxID=1154 RepID=UPI00232BDE84|nr:MULTISPECIES: hypothetical protein [Spirulina]MDB9496512.1 hypothetical protein [Spirulina subsalsa CS-330]MDB9504294.1 hypothetical protein [Spirulina major CS-329]
MFRLTVGLSVLVSLGAIALPPAVAIVHAQMREQGAIAPERVEALARHLNRINARVYSAHWCPHCRAQRAQFGPEDWLVRYGIYLECEPGGEQPASPALCAMNNIQAYPTWKINGEYHRGVISLETLAELSGFGDL